MHYVLLILGIITFVIWDVNMNRAQFTKPVAHFAYRVAGGCGLCSAGAGTSPWRRDALASLVALAGLAVLRRRRRSPAA